MVWLNTDCINYSPPRKNGEIVFGGAMCTCHKCRDERYEKQKKEEKENQCPCCKGTGIKNKSNVKV